MPQCGQIAPKTSSAARPPRSTPASRDEARACASAGSRGEPGDPMLTICWPRCCFRRGELEPARRHIEASLAKRPGNAAARLLAARIARGRRRFRRRAVRISIGRSRSPRSADALCREGPDARCSAGACGRRRASAWQAILRSCRRTPGGRGTARPAGVGRWRSRHRPPRCSSARRRRSARAGLVRSRRRSPGSARPRRGRRPPIARRSNSSPTTPKPRSISAPCLQESGDLDDAMRAYAEAYRLRPDCSAPSRWR